MDKVLEEFPYKNQIPCKAAASPAANYLFMVKENTAKIGPRRKEIFHSTVAQLLFLSIWMRPNILMMVTFLCTRVKEPDEDDWKKLIRVLGYLNGTRKLFLKIGIDDSNQMRFYADASFGVHKTYRSHIGGCMMMGTGCIISSSAKQKLNTKSSTEAELVAADKISNILMWSKNFMECQGYAKEVVLYQDNKATRLLLENGKASSGKRTRYLNIRYFYLHGLIKKQLMKTEYCLMSDMIADFFTKPLQAKHFSQLRAIIMDKNDKVRSVYMNTGVCWTYYYSM